MCVNVSMSVLQYMWHLFTHIPLRFYTQQLQTVIPFICSEIIVAIPSPTPTPTLPLGKWHNHVAIWADLTNPALRRRSQSPTVSASGGGGYQGWQGKTGGKTGTRRGRGERWALAKIIIKPLWALAVGGTELALPAVTLRHRLLNACRSKQWWWWILSQG